MSFRRTFSGVASLNAPLDAFSRLRVSQPCTLFDSKQLNAEHNAHFWSEKLVGYATAEVVEPEKLLSVLINGDRAISQTKMRFNYQPGKSQQVMMTGLFAPEAGVVKRIGQFDGTNGIFFQVDGSGPSWNVMSGGVVTESAGQDEWSEQSLAGILDLSAVQIVTFDYEWLGVGTVRCGFLIGGQALYVHKFHHANVPGNLGAYMKSPNLPIHYEIESLGGAGSLVQVCSTVISEGGETQYGMLHGIDNGTTSVHVTNAGDLVVLLAVRLKPPFESIVIPEFVSAMVATTNDNVRWCLLMNPTITNAAYLNWLASHTFEYAVGLAINLVTDPGQQMTSGYFPSDMRSAALNPVNALRMGATIDGEPDIMVLAAESLTANADLVGSLTLRELL